MLNSYNPEIEDIALVFAHAGTRADHGNRIYAIAVTVLSPSKPPRSFESLVHYPYLTERERFHSNVSKETLATAPEVSLVRQQVSSFLKDCPLILTLPPQDHDDDIATLCGGKRIVDLGFAVEFFLPQVDSHSLKRLWEYLHKQERDRIYFTANQAVELLTELIKHICGTELSDTSFPRVAALRHFLWKSKTLFGSLLVHLSRNYGKYFDIIFNPCQRPDTENWKSFFETNKPGPAEQKPPASFRKIDLAHLGDIYKGLAENTKGFTFRPSQVEYALHIAGAINDGAVLTIEAGTGTGKTQGYLIPVLEFLYRNHDARVAISTYTKSLQDQIFKQEIPFITEAIKFYRSIPFALLKGKSNYLCIEKLDGVYDDAWQGKTLLTWLYFVNLAYHFRDADGDRVGQRISHHLDDHFSLYHLQREISARSGCDAKHVRCPAQIMTREARSARLIVTNHHKLATLQHDAVLGGLFKIHIIDEANHFESAVRNTFGEEFNSRDASGCVEYLETALRKVVGRAAGDLEQDIKGTLKAIDTLKEGLQNFTDVLQQIAVAAKPNGHGELPVAHPAFSEGNVGKYLEVFRKAITEMSEHCEWLKKEELCRMLKLQDRTRTRMKSMLADLGEQSQTLKNLAENYARPNWLAMYDLSVRHWVLTAQPVEVASLVRDNFYRDTISLAYTSATISLDGDFKTFNQVVGMDRPYPVDEGGKAPRDFRFARVSSPFSAARAEISVPADAVSGIYSNKTLWVNSIAKLLPDLIKKNRGRTLVLFASYKDLEDVAKRVGNVIDEAGFPLILQRRGRSTGDLCDEFRAIKESVLFGVDTFWYGVDFKGDTLTQVIITRIPYPSSQDPLYTARRKTLHPIDYWARYSYDMFIKMKQGAGRLIRCETDQGKIVILDSRYGLQKEKMPPLIEGGEGKFSESDTHEESVQGNLLDAMNDEKEELFIDNCGRCGCEITEEADVCPAFTQPLKSGGKPINPALKNEEPERSLSVETDKNAPLASREGTHYIFGQFIKEMCLVEADAKVDGRSLHHAYRKWFKARQDDKKPLSRRALWSFLAGHEQIKITSKNPRIFSGIRLKNGGFHQQTTLDSIKNGQETDVSQIRELVLYIGNTGEHTERLIEYFRHPDYEVRRRACSAANKLHDKEITKYLEPCLYDPEPQVRQYALKAVLSSRCYFLVDHIEKIISREDKEFNLILCKRILKDCAPEIIREHRQKHPIPELSKPIPSTEPAFDPVPPENNGKRSYLVIGERFNQGCTIEQLAWEFKMQPNKIIEHLFRYKRENRLLCKEDPFINSLLTQDQRQAVLASFARLGTKKLRPIFDDLKGTIPYDEIKRCLLYYLTQDEIPSVGQKTFVCLAASRKYGGYCLAGKEWADGKVGPWLRPVSRQENGELATGEIRMNNGDVPQCMDIITIETEGAAGHRYQKENILIAGKIPWVWQWKLPYAALPNLVDDVNRLWQTGSHSTNGVNDRVPEEIVMTAKEPSLYLIRPVGFTLIVSADLDGRKKVRARFAYHDTAYLLSVTDPGIERTYLMEHHGEYPLTDKDLYLTVSLGEPFNGYCYKLVAAVITMEG
ncbi:MAG: dual OB domain-containing protein [Syntrophales bacterium]